MASDAFDKWWDRQPAEQDGGPAYGSSAMGWAAAVEACAAEVKAAGCPQARCGKDALAHEVPEAFEDESGVWHYPWCPVALAACLRRLA